MHHNIAAINQHPLTGTFALRADDMKASLFNLFDHVIGKRFSLARGIGTGNRDVIKNRRDFHDVDELNIARLDVFKCIDHDIR